MSKLLPRAKLVVVAFATLAALSCRERKAGPYGVTNPDDTAPPSSRADEPGLVIELGHADP
ncbi:MAG: hypothetical protein IAG13_05720, partial [Deltaproteobacteria bacterium]|nr:hypothetical protein [Nannocystaceae bacterium]